MDKSSYGGESVPAFAKVPAPDDGILSVLWGDRHLVQRLESCTTESVYDIGAVVASLF